jgi:hypothetical protein
LEKEFDEKLVDALFGAIELSAEKMARRIVDREEATKRLTEIKKTIFVLKKQLGLIPEEEEFKWTSSFLFWYN